MAPNDNKLNQRDLAESTNAALVEQHKTADTSKVSESKYLLPKVLQLLIVN